jgi:hypothetical protein
MQKSSKPSPSGEKGLGEKEREAAVGRLVVKILFAPPGVPPWRLEAVLQFRWSFDPRS